MKRQENLDQLFSPNA